MHAILKMHSFFRLHTLRAYIPKNACIFIDACILLKSNNYRYINRAASPGQYEANADAYSNFSSE